MGMREAKDSMSGSMRWRDSAMRRVLRHRIGGSGAEGERRRWERRRRSAGEEAATEMAARRRESGAAVGEVIAGGAMAARRALPRSCDGDARRRRGTGEARR
jgi:hypothetical protein